MIIDKEGESFEFEGKRYTIGALIYANDQSEYAGLFGRILEIRDGEDRETENETPDIYCEFEQPISPHDVSELETRFSNLYQTPKTIDDIALDIVIMAPDEITSVKDDWPQGVEVYVLEEDWAVDGDSGIEIEVYSDLLEARMNMRKKLRREALYGTISGWASNDDFTVEASEDSYEIYEEGHFCENHYTILIEKMNMAQGGVS